MKAKTISVYPKSETSKMLDELSKTLRTSRGGFCEIALEFVLPLVKAGKMQLVNGRFQLVKNSESERVHAS